MLEVFKAIVFGIVEGITEWLPVSSTGHLILLDEFLQLQVAPEFYEMFQVVIQLGAILAVIVLFFHKLNPFAPKKSAGEKKNTWQLWCKVAAATVPSAVIGLLLDDWMDTHLYNYKVVALALIAYGIAFLFPERGKEKGVIAPKTTGHCAQNYRSLQGAKQRGNPLTCPAGATGCRLTGGLPRQCEHWLAMTKESVYDIDYKTAVLIGCFQSLALIPGTSRSGATILGALLLGVSRPAGAEFSFFLAIPTMLGASALKLGKFWLSGAAAGATELAVLLVGCAVSFAVSVLVIRALMDYVRRHSFAAFGVYRIALGMTVLAYFAITG